MNPEIRKRWYNNSRDLGVVRRNLVGENIELRQTISELEQRPEIDSLTGLLAHAEVLERIKEHACGKDGPFSVIFMDLDDFKKVNDRFGHDVGDQVLLRFCELVAGSLRSMDVFGRVGGDEFVIILPHTNRAGKHIILDRIKRLAGNVAVEVNSCECSVEIGFSYGSLTVNNFDYWNLGKIRKFLESQMQRMKTRKKVGR